MPIKEYKNILVGVDGSSKSQIAFKEAINIGIRNGATVTVAQIINTTHSILPRDSIEVLKDNALENIKALEEQAKNMGYSRSIISRIEAGSPKEFIATTLPKELEIDLIVVGETGKHFIKGSSLGSITVHVVRTAPCNVLVCR